MNNYRIKGQMDLSDLLAIEIGIHYKDSLKKITRLIGRHPSTVAHEIKENRTFIHNTYYLGKDCAHARRTNVVHHVCGDLDCKGICCKCKKVDCQKYCEKYISQACHKFERAPYVCNNCPKKRLCVKDKYVCIQCQACRCSCVTNKVREPQRRTHIRCTKAGNG